MSAHWATTCSRCEDLSSHSLRSRVLVILLFTAALIFLTGQQSWFLCKMGHTRLSPWKVSKPPKKRLHHYEGAMHIRLSVECRNTFTRSPFSKLKPKSGRLLQGSKGHSNNPSNREANYQARQATKQTYYNKSCNITIMRIESCAPRPKFTSFHFLYLYSLSAVGRF